MKKLSKTLLAVLAAGEISCVLFSEQAQAMPITGGISMAGGATFDTGDINTAEAFASFYSVITTVGTGSYATVPIATPVTMNPFSFDPFPGGGVIPLWSFVAGGLTYSFDLTSLTTFLQPGDNTL